MGPHPKLEAPACALHFEFVTSEVLHVMYAYSSDFKTSNKCYTHSSYYLV